MITHGTGPFVSHLYGLNVAFALRVLGPLYGYLGTSRHNLTESGPRYCESWVYVQSVDEQGNAVEGAAVDLNFLPFGQATCNYEPNIMRFVSHLYAE